MTIAQTYKQRCDDGELESVLTKAFHQCTLFKCGRYNATKLIADTLFTVSMGLGGETIQFGFEDGSALQVTPQDEHFVFTAGKAS
jgi:hypothetical protein